MQSSGRLAVVISDAIRRAAAGISSARRRRTTDGAASREPPTAMTARRTLTRASSRATRPGSCPRLLVPSVMSSTARGPRAGKSVEARCSASPIAVGPFGLGSNAKAFMTAARSAVGAVTIRAVSAKATMPRRVPGGSAPANERIARDAASARLGARSRDRIDPDVSMQITIVPTDSKRCTYRGWAVASTRSVYAAAVTASSAIAGHTGAFTAVVKNVRCEYANAARRCSPPVMRSAPKTAGSRAAAKIATPGCRKLTPSERLCAPPFCRRIRPTWRRASVPFPATARSRCGVLGSLPGSGRARTCRCTRSAACRFRYR